VNNFNPQLFPTYV